MCFIKKVHVVQSLKYAIDKGTNGVISVVGKTKALVTRPNMIFDRSLH
jgi:hypothetical protein